MGKKQKGKGPSGKATQYPVCAICGHQQPFDLRLLRMDGRQVFCGDCKRSNPDRVKAAMDNAGYVINMRRAA